MIIVNSFFFTFRSVFFLFSDLYLHKYSYLCDENLITENILT